MPERIREVIRDPLFERQMRALVRHPIAADQFVEGAEFLLARDPFIGSPTDDSRLPACLTVALPR